MNDAVQDALTLLSSREYEWVYLRVGVM